MKDPVRCGERFCHSLSDAMDGFGTDEMGLIFLLLAVRFDPKERVNLLTNYQKLKGKSLVEDIRKETSGLLELFLLGLVESQPKLWARAFHLAIHPQWTFGL